jgi:hypothetical protein
MTQQCPLLTSKIKIYDCFIKFVKKNELLNLSSIHNTLYLNIIGPSVKPEMIVLSKETNNIDFGKVSIGHKCIKKVAIKNISDRTIEVIFT